MPTDHSQTSARARFRLTACMDVAQVPRPQHDPLSHTVAVNSKLPGNLLLLVWHTHLSVSLARQFWQCDCGDLRTVTFPLSLPERGRRCHARDEQLRTVEEWLDIV